MITILVVVIVAWTAIAASVAVATTTTIRVVTTETTPPLSIWAAHALVTAGTPRMTVAVVILRAIVGPAAGASVLLRG